MILYSVASCMNVPSHAFSAIQCLLSPACFASPAFCPNVVLYLLCLFFSCNSELPFLNLSLCSCALTFASCVYFPPLVYFFLQAFSLPCTLPFLCLFHFLLHVVIFTGMLPLSHILCHSCGLYLSHALLFPHLCFVSCVMCFAFLCFLPLFLSAFLSSVFCAHALPLVPYALCLLCVCFAPLVSLICSFVFYALQSVCQFRHFTLLLSLSIISNILLSHAFPFSVFLSLYFVSLLLSVSRYLPCVTCCLTLSLTVLLSSAHYPSFSITLPNHSSPS